MHKDYSRGCHNMKRVTNCQKARGAREAEVGGEGVAGEREADMV